MTHLDDLAELTDAHYESMREMQQLVQGPVPAPAAYQALGNLKNSAGGMTATVLSTLAVRLQESLSQYDVYDLNRHPSESVATAVAHLVEAADHATRIGALLEQAQVAINSQGYNLPPESAA